MDMTYYVGDLVSLNSGSLVGGKFKIVKKIKKEDISYEIEAVEDLESKWIVGGIVKVGCKWVFGENGLRKITSKNMQPITAMLRRALDEDMQTLYKAGYLDENLKLTERGIEALNTVVFDAYKDKLVQEAKVEIAQENDKSSV